MNSSHTTARNSSSPLTRCRMDTQPGNGRRISNRSAGRLRYLGLGLLIVAFAMNRFDEGGRPGRPAAIIAP